MLMRHVFDSVLFFTDSAGAQLSSASLYLISRKRISKVSQILMILFMTKAVKIQHAIFG
jgi:hypothetical protein